MLSLCVALSYCYLIFWTIPSFPAFTEAEGRDGWKSGTSLDLWLLKGQNGFLIRIRFYLLLILYMRKQNKVWFGYSKMKNKMKGNKKRWGWYLCVCVEGLRNLTLCLWEDGQRQTDTLEVCVAQSSTTLFLPHRLRAREGEGEKEIKRKKTRNYLMSQCVAWLMSALSQVRYPLPLNIL